MMGFLLKMSTSVRKDWKRRWFLLQGGNLYYVRDWKDTSPTLVCEVLLCTVRTCTGAKAHRFSFELISPNRRTFTLQASNERDMHAWMLAMQNATEHLLVGGGSSGGNSNTNNSSSSSTTTTDSATTPSNDHPPLVRKIEKLKCSKLCTILVVIIVKIIFIRSFLFCCLLYKHSFKTNPNTVTNLSKLFNYICSMRSSF